MIPVELERMKSILDFILGSPKADLDESLQLEYPCPRCVDIYGIKEVNKYNLSLSLGKQVYQCWKCADSGEEDMKGRITKLIKLYGNTQLYKEYMECIKSLRDNKLYSLDFHKDDSQTSTFDEVELPNGFRPFRPDRYYPDGAFEYLQKRGIDWDIINQHEIGFIGHNEEHKNLSNRIVIPSRDAFGTINYWTGRDFTGNDKRMKYMNPKVDRKNIIFDEEKVQWDADITLVEGPFDHIVVPNSIPLLGKSLGTDYKLYWDIITNGKKRSNLKVNIWLDGDAYESVKQIYKTLNHGNLYGKIRYIPTDGDYDPSLIFQEGGRRAIIDFLKSARKIPEYEL